MANLDVEDITLIRTMFKEEIDELKSDVTKEITLIVEPIKDTLTNHIEHDEKVDEKVQESLKTLEKGQTKIFAYGAVAMFLGAPLLSYGVKLLADSV